MARASWSCNSSSPLLCGQACSASGGGPEPTAAEEAGDRKTLRHRWTRDQNMQTHSKKFGCSQSPSTGPLPNKRPLRARLGVKVMEPESREGQRATPPSEEQAADKERDDQHAEGQQGPGLQRDLPWFPMLQELPRGQKMASVSRQNCSPGKNNWDLSGKAISIQAVEPNKGNKNPWCQEEDKEMGDTGHIMVKSLGPGPAEGRGDRLCIPKKRTETPDPTVSIFSSPPSALAPCSGTVCRLHNGS